MAPPMLFEMLLLAAAVKANAAPAQPLGEDKAPAKDVSPPSPWGARSAAPPRPAG